MVAEKRLWAQIDQMEEIIEFQKVSKKVDEWNERIKNFNTELEAILKKTAKY